MSTKPNRFASSICFGASEPEKPHLARKNPGASHLDGTLRPKTPAKAKAVRERFGTEHPAQSSNGHHIGEEHLYVEGLIVSPKRIHEMLKKSAAAMPAAAPAAHAKTVSGARVEQLAARVQGARALLSGAIVKENRFDE